MKTFEWIAMSSVAVFLVTTPASSAAEEMTECEMEEEKGEDGDIGVCFNELLDMQLTMIDDAETMVSGMGDMNLLPETLPIRLTHTPTRDRLCV